jgi:2-keto-4-pentenoate hydratase
LTKPVRVTGNSQRAGRTVVRDSVAWVADHLAAHSRGVLRGDFVITGSIITSKNVRPGDFIKFSVEGLGEVELRMD